ncbi:MarR family winged helix-turn-helix transcriptional regulator [Anaeromicropila populeti]|uniref:HTH-type transcriptional regulator SarZ n=1 Tax=Anaeromicropila populeti TaxID=37658 RepID=A0A1I6LFM0_9FIRM|nr:MarR family transcriptional regulator [Anaeromicropila populeti]SFS02246.1 DNA-binding transcriptional regulator, MarR family [Anaeromicropila populeti]
METSETINDLLIKLLDDIVKLEQKAVITGEFKDISSNDLHIIDAIGSKSARNMSAVAKSLKVTVGTLTIAINSLVKKGYVQRTRSDQDRRVVLITLSEKGEKAFAHHQRFHKEMVEGVLDKLSQNEADMLVSALKSISAFLSQYH